MGLLRTFTAVVADELPLISEGIATLCAGFPGCHVLSFCSDGEEAWNVIERLSPDIALLDMHLPKLMTLELLRRTRLHSLATKIVTLGTRCDRRTVLEALRAGASGYVLKSGSGRHLEEAFHHVMLGGVYISPHIELQKIVAPPREDPEDPLKLLSAREHQVFSLLVEGVRPKEIASRLSLSPKTVDTYRASLMRKLDIHDVPSLVKFAIHHQMTGMV